MGALTQRKTGENRMLKLVSVTIAGALMCGIAFTSTSTKAADEPDKAAVQKATTDCRAEVKEQARFHEMSWNARHKAVKNCVKSALAKH
jgi:hypothetical protein